MLCIFDTHITIYRFVCMDVTRENHRRHSGTEFDEIFESIIIIIIIIVIAVIITITIVVVKRRMGTNS